jgi:hypothetical protein
MRSVTGTNVFAGYNRAFRGRMRRPCRGPMRRWSVGCHQLCGRASVPASGGLAGRSGQLTRE